MYRRFTFEAVQGSKNLTNLKVLPPIGEGGEDGSVNLSDILVEESDGGSNGSFPRPVNKIEILDKKSRNVHFDQFVYIRLVVVVICCVAAITPHS